jgi:hypothetical protein
MFSRRSSIAGFMVFALAAAGVDAEPSLSRLSQTNVPDVPGGQTIAVARIVHGIIGYSQWPARPAPVRLCIAGAPRFAGALPLAGSGVAAARGTPGLSGDGCDALYLGPLPPGARGALLARMRGRPVVTIDEADPGCRSGAMFCLAVGQNEVSLEMNLDAVSRGGVRIDPRVLRLARPGGGGR